MRSTMSNLFRGLTQRLPPHLQTQVGPFLSSVGRALLPYEIGKNAPIGDIILGEAYWIESIFNRAMSGIKWRNINSVFLSLAVAKIIHIKRINENAQRWKLVWLNRDTPAYNRDENWEGIKLFNSSKPRSGVPTTETTS